jgi:ADP-heptose:LPS heptosyltransferase
MEPIQVDLEKAKLAEGNIWQDEYASLRGKVKKASSTKIRELGLTKGSLRMVDALEDLDRDPPNIVIAEAKKNFYFTQNHFKMQMLKKRGRYIMGLGVFQQLQFETGTNKKILKPSPIKFKNIYKPYNGEPLNGKSILIFRTGGIGDLLFIQPNLRWIKEQYPESHIMFACGPQYQAMVETWDCIDELLDLPFSISALKRADYHVLFEGVIERCKQAHTDNAYNLFSKWMGLDLSDELLIPKQDPKEECLEETRKVLGDWGLPEKSFIVMQLRASSPIRTPRHEFWVELMDMLNDVGYDVVLTDNPIQNEAIEEFRKSVKNPDKVYNFCKHSKSLDYSIALIKLAKLVVATDSAMNHIAASLDTACFGVYGPFPGYIRLKTYPKCDWIDSIRRCAPCFLHGHTPCPESSSDGYSPCYDELDKTEIVKRIQGLMEDD